MRRLAVATGIIAILNGCASGPQYNRLDSSIVPKDVKIGLLQQTECIFPCTSATDPKTYTDTFRARLEERLNRPVKLVEIAGAIEFDWSEAKMAQLGKQADVDYLVGGRLVSYKDPSSASRAGTAAVTALTTATSFITGVAVVSTTRPGVSSNIAVIRTSDGKVIGEYRASEQGGNFAKCTSLVEDIADTVAEKQFLN